MLRGLDLSQWRLNRSVCAGVAQTRPELASISDCSRQWATLCLGQCSFGDSKAFWFCVAGKSRSNLTFVSGFSSRRLRQVWLFNSWIRKYSKLRGYCNKCQLTLVLVVDEHARFVLKSLILFSQICDFTWFKDSLYTVIISLLFILNNFGGLYLELLL